MLFEYKCVIFENTAVIDMEMNEYGSIGWELVSLIPSGVEDQNVQAFFKRPLGTVDDQFNCAIDNFVQHFELVFDNDWDVSKTRLQTDDYISGNGTFIDPGVEDESNNWANRGSLLASYRELKDLMKQRGFAPAPWSR